MEDAKTRSKALKVAVGLFGVISAQIDGEKIVVVGDGIDSVTLTVMLRKKMGYAEIVSVSAVEEKEKKKDEASRSVQQVTWPYWVQMAPQPYVYETRECHDSEPCSIM